MAQPLEITIRISDYASVKAALDAADAVLEAQGEAPWTLSEAIDHLGRCMADLPPKDNDDEDGGN